MDLKSLLLPLGLSLLTVVIIQKFFFNGGVPTNQYKAGSFVAPKSKQQAKPLNREIDFIDEKRRGEETVTEIETNLARFTFSDHGASLTRFEVKRKINGKINYINTVFPTIEREDRCFLVALNEKTPYYYKLVGKRETDVSIELSYKYDSPLSDVKINKTYRIFKSTYKVELELEVSPKKKLEDGVQARIFFPSPFTPEIDGGPSAMVIDDREKPDKIQIIAGGSINAQQGWYSPSMFGAYDKYFVNSMVEDLDGFAQRAYFRGKSKEKLFAIIEGPELTESKKWTVGFYFGPKEERALIAVDTRLEQTLSYSGLLAPISKFLIELLNFLYKYVGNYGLAIILLTILMRLLLLPFTWGASKGANKHKDLQKKLKYVGQKYKHDREMLNRAKADLMRKHGMPGLSSCLPALVQLPIFFALGNVLRGSIELYKAPFVFWITDLSAKDPYYILPVLMGLTMLLQAATVDKDKRFMFIVVAFVMGAFTASMASGLALYIMMSVGLGALQSWIQKEKSSSNSINTSYR